MLVALCKGIPNGAYLRICERYKDCFPVDAENHYDQQNLGSDKIRWFGFVYFGNEEDCKKALEESQDNEYFSVAPGRKTRCSDTKGNYKKEVVKKNRGMTNRGLKKRAMKKRAMKKRAKNSVQNVN